MLVVGRVVVFEDATAEPSAYPTGLADLDRRQLGLPGLA